MFWFPKWTAKHWENPRMVTRQNHTHTYKREIWFHRNFPHYKAHMVQVSFPKYIKLISDHKFNIFQYILYFHKEFRWHWTVSFIGQRHTQTLFWQKRCAWIDQGGSLSCCSIHHDVLYWPAVHMQQCCDCGIQKMKLVISCIKYFNQISHVLTIICAGIANM